ncbi:PTS system cellobiose-specific IIB component [Scopulibacillus daqui]|uniref:PTS system cellobiose-specific IIB component n=1 Tax=Scopulibacillus daqui TaxID=1469162 RepID=A0ABS2PYI6_9BACL|nr:PTS sugar transporter subunit IIB [Scopulibacillus daqui]MBM7645114.1 PTS system cellobiose-specific IIB component [Scopulibacillus daqui]
MNILLCCAGGMSTSLLVTKMREAAEGKGMEINISAVGLNEVDQHIDDADILLLGPQVRYKLVELKKLTEEKGIPIDVINPIDYGMVNGKNVLEHALTFQK